MQRKKAEDHLKNRERSLELKRANIFFYDSNPRRENMTRNIPESDFIESKFGVKLAPSLLVAEIGCGTASILLSLDTNEKLGVDISKTNLMLAKQRNSRLTLLRADAEHIPFRCGVLDVIIIVDLLHHVPKPQKVIKEAAKILEYGGKLFMYDACVDGVKPIYPFAVLIQEITRRIGKDIEHFGPRVNNVITWLMDAGFRSTKVFGEGSFIRFIDSVIASFSKRLHFPNYGVRRFSAIDSRVAHLFRRFPIKVGIMATKVDE